MVLGKAEGRGVEMAKASWKMQGDGCCTLRVGHEVVETLEPYHGGAFKTMDWGKPVEDLEDAKAKLLPEVIATLRERLGALEALEKAAMRAAIDEIALDRREKD